jgi:hypothetical protein
VRDEVRERYGSKGDGEESLNSPCILRAFKKDDQDYISLTDIARFKNASHTDDLIRNWLRNRNTLEFLGIWEKLNNSHFNPLEFDGIKKQAGLNSFPLTPKQWIEKTAAIGIVSKAGRYGGTFTHKDIAFEFATWISVEFKLYLIQVPRERSRPTSVRHRRIRRIGQPTHSSGSKMTRTTACNWSGISNAPSKKTSSYIPGTRMSPAAGCVAPLPSFPSLPAQHHRNSSPCRLVRRLGTIALPNCEIHKYPVYLWKNRGSNKRAPAAFRPMTARIKKAATASVVLLRAI